MSIVVQDKGYLAAAGLVISGAAALLGYRKVAATGALASVIFGGYGYYTARGAGKALEGKVTDILSRPLATSKDQALSTSQAVKSLVKTVKSQTVKFLGHSFFTLDVAKIKDLKAKVKEHYKHAVSLWSDDLDGVLKQDNTVFFTRDVVFEAFTRATNAGSTTKPSAQYHAGLKFISDLHSEYADKNIQFIEALLYSSLETVRKGMTLEDLGKLLRNEKDESLKPALQKAIRQRVIGELEHYLNPLNPSDRTEALKCCLDIEKDCTRIKAALAETGMDGLELVKPTLKKFIISAGELWTDHIPELMTELAKCANSQDPGNTSVQVLSVALQSDFFSKTRKTDIDTKREVALDYYFGLPGLFKTHKATVEAFAKHDYNLRTDITNEIREKTVKAWAYGKGGPDYDSVIRRMLKEKDTAKKAHLIGITTDVLVEYLGSKYRELDSARRWLFAGSEFDRYAPVWKENYGAELTGIIDAVGVKVRSAGIRFVKVEEGEKK